MLRSGDVLNDRYRLDAPIASGGMGEVWRATDVALDRRVAVKVLRPALLADPESNVRFRAEARATASLTHPNVVHVYDYGCAPLAGERIPYMVMSHVDGRPLSHRIAEAGRLSAGETGALLIQAAGALHAAHRGGIVHCDVNPANLLVAPNGTVTLVDFGVARSTTETVAQAVMATALYVAPEQVSGRPVTPSTDVYALGVVAYHCLSGQPPFTGETPLQIALRHVHDDPPPLPSDVPPELQLVVARALSKDPELRYRGAAAFAGALRRALVGRSTAPTVHDLPVVRDAEPAVYVRAGPLARGRLVLVASAAAVLLFGAGGLALVRGAVQPTHPGPGGRPGSAAPSVNIAAVPGEASAVPNWPSGPGSRAPVGNRGAPPVQPSAVAALVGKPSGTGAPSMSPAPPRTSTTPSPSATVEPSASATAGPSASPVPSPGPTSAVPTVSLVAP